MIPVGIVTTASRDALLAEQLPLLGEPAPHVYRDLAPGLTPNHRAAWRALFEHGDRALLLQDDAIPAGNWRRAVDLICARFPNAPVVNLFTLGKRVATSPDARMRGYLTQRGFDSTSDLALILRRDTYTDFDAWVDAGEYTKHTKNPEITLRHHDGLLRRYLHARGLTVILLTPSLFQHVGTKSTVGHGWRPFGRERIDPDWPGADFDYAAHLARLWGTP